MSLNAISDNATRLLNSYVAIPDTTTSVPFSPLLLGGFTFAAFVVTTLYTRQSSKGNQVPYKYGAPFIGSWAFFTRRYYFIYDSLKRFGGKFRFSILQHKVLVVTGEEARKVFYGHRDLSLSEGFKVLFGGNPALDEAGIQRERDPSDMQWFGKRITNALKYDRLQILIPQMISDVDKSMRDWPKTGQFDTFDKIYDMIFQLSVRMGTCNEIANSPEMVARVSKLYWATEKGSTAVSVLLPWLPSKARRSKDKATIELFMIVKGIIDERRRTGRQEMDTLQVLLDEGDNVKDIGQFILSTLFAGVINTGIMASWIPLYLHVTPEWKARAINEVRSFIAQYAPKDCTNLVEQLSQIPPQAWDESMPVLDLCLRETIRTVLSAMSLRRVLDDGVVVDGVKVEKGSFIAHPMHLTHTDKDVYTNPDKWDPGRFERGEDKKQQWSFVGWGVGRHPCLGMRFAKLEVKIIIALFLMRCEYSLVDENGKPMDKLPEPCREDLYQTPPSAPVFVKYKKVDV